MTRILPLLLLFALVSWSALPVPASASEGSSVSKPLPKIELYVTSWCPYCKKAQMFLTARQVPFEVYDVEKDREAARRFREISPRGGVPVAVIGDRVIRGFSTEAYDLALEEAGRAGR